MKKIGSCVVRVFSGFLLVLMIITCIQLFCALTRPTVTFFVPVFKRSFHDSTTFRFQVVGDADEEGCRKCKHLQTGEVDISCPEGVNPADAEITSEMFILPFDAVKHDRVMLQSDVIRFGDKYRVSYSGMDSKGCNSVIVRSDGIAIAVIMPIPNILMVVSSTMKACY